MTQINQSIEEQMRDALGIIISQVKKDSIWILLSLVISVAIGIGFGELLFL